MYISVNIYIYNKNLELTTYFQNLKICPSSLVHLFQSANAEGFPFF